MNKISTQPKRRRRARLSPLLLLLFVALCASGCALTVDQEPRTTPADSVREAVSRAGNAHTDTERLAILKRLSDLPNLDLAVKRDTDRLIAAIERWTTSKRLDYFGGQIGRTRNYNFGIGKDSPLYPLTCFYRGRMLFWLTLENSGIRRNPQRRKIYLDKAVANFRIAKQAFPNNRIVRMYLGESIPTEKRYSAPPHGAPEWAIFQREGLERLTDIIVWWIDHRMQEDGQYGGGWGDDCEMWRWWRPVLVGFNDAKITAAQEKFSIALMSQGHMTGGYTSRMTDVEHTAEDSADVITPMMHLAPDDAIWRNRSLRLVELMEKLWTGRNQRGQLQFKSTYFTVSRVDTNPNRACDTVYHPRAVQPALLLWQRTGDKRLGRLFSTWMDTWVDAAARAERGKPAGIIPSAIHWPDGRVGGTHPDWWDPHNHRESTLYLWPTAMTMMCNTLLLTWHMTGDEKYLRPIRSMAAIRLKYLKNPPKEPPAPGSEAWCAAKLGLLAGTLAKYKRLTGSKEFDELLARDYPMLMALEAGGRRAVLVDSLRRTVEALRVNFEGYTSEVRYTDRVLRFPTMFEPGMMFREGVADFRTPNSQLLYATVTGDPGDGGYFPLNAVRWLTPPRDIAVLVTAAGDRRFAAELYHFGVRKRPLGAELYLLKPGRYEMILRTADEPPVSQEVVVTGLRTRIRFELPPRKLCTLTVRRK